MLVAVVAGLAVLVGPLLTLDTLEVRGQESAAATEEALENEVGILQVRCSMDECPDRKQRRRREEEKRRRSGVVERGHDCRIGFSADKADKAIFFMQNFLTATSQLSEISIQRSSSCFMHNGNPRASSDQAPTHRGR